MAHLALGQGMYRMSQEHFLMIETKKFTMNDKGMSEEHVNEFNRACSGQIWDNFSIKINNNNR